jgi:hypothetical protein
MGKSRPAGSDGMRADTAAARPVVERVAVGILAVGEPVSDLCFGLATSAPASSGGATDDD